VDCHHRDQAGLGALEPARVVAGEAVIVDQQTNCKSSYSTTEMLAIAVII
jgi:hypothetical protein